MFSKIYIYYSYANTFDKVVNELQKDYSITGGYFQDTMDTRNFCNGYHFVISNDDGSVIQMVDENIIAYHSGVITEDEISLGILIPFLPIYVGGFDDFAETVNYDRVNAGLDRLDTYQVASNYAYAMDFFGTTGISSLFDSPELSNSLYESISELVAYLSCKFKLEVNMDLFKYKSALLNEGAIPEREGFDNYFIADNFGFDTKRVIDKAKELLENYADENTCEYSYTTGYEQDSEDKEDEETEEASTDNIMSIKVYRDTFTDISTIGKLYLDGVFECYTLEDRVRTGTKVYGTTAIPSGKYKVVVNYSPSAGTDLPLLINVPNFTGIRIHIGNYPTDSEGCILVGESPGKDMIYKSTEAFGKLFRKVQDAIAEGKEIEIDVRRYV